MVMLLFGLFLFFRFGLALRLFIRVGEMYFPAAQFRRELHTLVLFIPLRLLGNADNRFDLVMMDN